MAATLGLRPLRDKIIVKRLEEETKTAGGLYIPDSAKEKPQKGKVVAVGTGRLTEDGKTIPFEVKKGDNVLFQKYSGTEVKFEGEDYLILDEGSLLAVLN